MKDVPSHRPTFTGPTAIRRDAVTRFIWGDAESGEVADWIYVSSDRIHQLVFGLPPGGAFRHSKSFPTVFAADELYVVLSGTLVLNNPQTGEVCRAEPGEAIFFRRDTWHHGYSLGSHPLRVLEYFAPPPSQGTAGDYARRQPRLAQARTAQDEWLGRWPMQRGDALRKATLHRAGPDAALARLEGLLLVELFVATEYLSAGAASLLPGHSSDLRSHAGDLALLVREGVLHVQVPAEGDPLSFELREGDGFYLPMDVPRRFFNYGDAPARWYFGVAPGYLGPPGASAAGAGVV